MYENKDIALEMFIWTNVRNNLCSESLLPKTSEYLKCVTLKILIKGEQ